MNPQEKAKELIEYFAETVPHKEFGEIMERDWLTAKKCALITATEVINEFPVGHTGSFEQKRQKYWKEVKDIIWEEYITP
jgi:hypothetical protein